ncbi:MAG: hypothetical protein IID32_10260 [Planctomycetes bacterium]|nr:hypothetical protein [Planctomycetota bacterium]
MALGASVSVVQAEGFTVDNEFSSKYMWRGFDLFDDHGAWMPSVDFELAEGWGLNVWSAQPFGSGNQKGVEYDYTLSFSNTINEGETDEVEYSVGYIMYQFPNKNDLNANEIGIGFSFPSALSGGDLPLVPSVYLGKFEGDGGAYYSFRLDWEVECPDTGQVFGVYGDVAYNDGMGTYENSAGDEFDIGSDLSHVSFGISTDVEIMDISISPFVNYQMSLEDTINSDDELWAGFSTSITF